MTIGNAMKIKNLRFTRGLLLLSGLVAVAIAATILVAPQAFYASYDIELGGNVDLVNELKAPAGALLVAGFLMLVGVVRTDFAPISFGTAAAVYLSYGGSRLVSMLVDGMPNESLVSAALVEVLIGAVCLFGLTRLQREKTIQSHHH